MMKTLLLFLIVTFNVAITSQALPFEWKADLDSVEKSGFYDIYLPPDLTACLNERFSDIRLYDAQGTEVPYLQKAEVFESHRKTFIEYGIVSKEHLTGKTVLVLENPEKTRINNINLRIRNADVRKKVLVSGSEDQKDWYLIKDTFYLQSIFSHKETYELKIINFPLSDYRYYKIEISDRESPPIDIQAAGYYDRHTQNGKFSPVEEPSVTQIDSVPDKRTYVYINFERQQYIDRLVFDLKGPRYYLRQATLYELKKVKIKRRKARIRKVRIKTMTLQSNEVAIMDLHKLAGKKLLLQIDNHDNPPLTVQKVTGFQLNQYLTAYLEKDQVYSVRFGNPNIVHPVYDLAYFKNKIPERVPMVRIQEKQKIHRIMHQVTAILSTNKSLIWAAILVVMLLLGFLTLRMVNEMSPS